MKAKSIFLILAACSLSFVQVTKAGKLPKCENQPDLLDYYASIFERRAQNSVVKRQMSWTFSCLHASIIKDEDDNAMYSNQIYECCNKCEFPEFSLCSLAESPDWLCGSEAYDCVFACRDEDSVLEAVVEASSSNLERKRDLSDLNITDSQVTRVRRRLRMLRRERKCYERTCAVKDGKRECCLTNTCVSLTNLVTELRKKKKQRAKKLRKAAKTTSAATTTPTTTPATK